MYPFDRLASTGQHHHSRHRTIDRVWTTSRNALQFIQLVQRNPASQGGDVAFKGIRALSLMIVAIGVLFTGGAASAQDKITVWWGKGFYKSEDDALLATIKRVRGQDRRQGRIVAVSHSGHDSENGRSAGFGTPPDVAYSDTYDVQAGGKWGVRRQARRSLGYPGSDEIAFAPNTLETAYLFNDQTKKKAYYGFPLKQQTMHVQIWSDMLEQAGYKISDIPTKWADYWSFWCDKVQPAYRKAREHVRSASVCRWVWMSTDSLQSFYTFMDAYNVKLVDDDGKLLVDDPKVREGLIGALKDYTDPYIKGCTPPSSTTWKDPDNNVAFHNKTTVMTHNFTISIAGKWFEDSQNPALTPEQRAAGKKAYEETIITAAFQTSRMVRRSSIVPTSRPV